MKWKQIAPDQWRCEVPPDARFTLLAFAKGDGRWTWEVYAREARGPMASGSVGSLGAAKNAIEGFMTRAGHT